MKKQNKAVKIWDILPIDTEIEEIEILNNYPIYQFLSDGIVMENPGLKKDESELLFYNVSNAPDIFKEKYKKFIIELEINKIYKYRENKNNLKEKNEIKDNVSKKEGALITLLPCGDFYFSLSNEDKRNLGNKFYKIINSNGGVKLDPIISIKGNLYEELMDSCISVDPETISESLWSKIQNYTIELRENKPGLWNSIDNGYNKIK